MTLFNDGLSREPLRHKTEMIRTVLHNGDLTIIAAYGSAKDVSVYHSIPVPSERIFVVGKMKSRLQNQAQFISEGYAVHLGECIARQFFG
jgi:membrane-associated phosphatidylinositol transfer protein